MLRQKNDRDILNLQQPLTNNNQHNIIPPKSITIKNNLINNKLLLNTNKKLIIDPQNKAKLLKTKPVDGIYKDTVTKNDLQNYNYSNIYNPYLDHNRPKKIIENPLSEKQHKYFQSSLMRYPYWAPLWMQYNDPHIKMYDLTVLMPITNGEVGIEQINKIKSYKKNESNKPNKISNHTYAPFIYPMPIIVRRKNSEPTKPTKLTKSTKPTKNVEKFMEFFRLPQTFSQQNRVNRTNHIRGPSRGIATQHINTPSRLMRQINVANNKAQLLKPVMVGNKGNGGNGGNGGKETRGVGRGAGRGVERVQTDYRHGTGSRHVSKYGSGPRHSPYRNYGSSSYWGGGGYYGYPYCAYGNCPYNPYYGTYNYYPFSDYFLYENRYRLPFDLNSALLPVNPQSNLSIQQTQPSVQIQPPVQIQPQPQQTQSEKKWQDKIERDIQKLLKKSNKKSDSSKSTSTNSSNSTSTNSSNSTSTNLSNSTSTNLSNSSKTTTNENFTNDPNKTTNKNLLVPEGFIPVTLRIIEILDDNDNDNDNENNNNIDSQPNMQNNMIFLVLLIMIVVYLYTNVYGKK